MNISIIIPVYNVESYLSKCLESCLNQGVPPSEYEVIVVNDGSPDNSFSIIEKYKKQYDNIIVIDKKNGGLSSARNAGLSIAKGDYVWFVDADDYISNNALVKIISVISNIATDIICVDAYIEDHKGDTIIQRTRPRKLQKEGVFTPKKLFVKGFFYPYSGAQYYIVKRSFLQNNEITFIEGFLYEDVLYTPTILARAKNCYYLNDNLYVYIERYGSITGSSMTLKKNTQLLHIIDMLYDEYRKNFSRDGRYILRESILMIMSTYYHYYYSALSNADDKSIAREMFLKKKYLLILSFRALNLKSFIRWGQMFFNL